MRRRSEVPTAPSASGRARAAARLVGLARGAGLLLSRPWRSAAATSAVRPETPSFSEQRLRFVRTVSRLMYIRAPICASVRPRDASASPQLADARHPLRARQLAMQARLHLRRNPDTAGGHHPHGGEDLVPPRPLAEVAASAVLERGADSPRIAVGGQDITPVSLRRMTSARTPRPSSSGMRRSTSATTGRCSWIAASAARPSPQLATTRTSPCSGSTRASPSANAG